MFSLGFILYSRLAELYGLANAKFRKNLLVKINIENLKKYFDYWSMTI